MECLIGIVGKDFVMLASDMNLAHSIVVMKHDDDKMYKLNKSTAMLVCGEPGDRVQFAEYIQRNLQLYKMINGFELSTHATVNYTRRELATSLRSQNSYNVNMLIAGWDKFDGPSLYHMDYLSAAVKIPFGLQGYGQYFGLSIGDRYYKPDMNEDEVMDLLQKIIAEIQKRFLGSLPMFQVRIIDKDGIRDGPIISTKGTQQTSESMDTV